MISDDRTYVDLTIPLSQESGFGAFDIGFMKMMSGGQNMARNERKKALRELEEESQSPLHLFDFSQVDEGFKEAFAAQLDKALRDARTHQAQESRRKRSNKFLMNPK